MGDIDLKVGINAFFQKRSHGRWETTKHEHSISPLTTHMGIYRESMKDAESEAQKREALKADLLQVIQRYQKLLVVLEDLEDAGRRDNLSFLPGEHGYTTGFLFASINVGHEWKWQYHDLGAFEVLFWASPPEELASSSISTYFHCRKSSKIIFKEAHLWVSANKMSVFPISSAVRSLFLALFFAVSPGMLLPLWHGLGHVWRSLTSPWSSPAEAWPKFGWGMVMVIFRGDMLWG